MEELKRLAANEPHLEGYYVVYPKKKKAPKLENDWIIEIEKLRTTIFNLRRALTQILWFNPTTPTEFEIQKVARGALTPTTE